MKNRLITLTLIAGLLAISGVAAAADTAKDDTVFNFGYDEEADVLFRNTTPNDGLYDCSLEGGALNTTYDVTDDGLVQVDELTDADGVTVTFPARPQDDLADGLAEAEEDAQYTGAEGECGLTGATVAGPNGQINHGMFMKLINRLFDTHAHGCLNRYLAQSSLGKGDQQIRVSEVDPDAQDIADGDTGIVEFQTEMADCVHGHDGAPGQEKAAERRAAKADHPRGKSNQAPGRNK